MGKPKFFVNSAGIAAPKKYKPEVDKTAPKRDLIPIDYMSDTELWHFGTTDYHTMIFDIESYVNFFMIGFFCLTNKKYVAFVDSPDESIDIEKLEFCLSRFRLVSFNGNKYDIPMAMLALRGYKAEMLKYYTNKLIQRSPDGKPVYINWREEFGLKDKDWDHIDLMAVCPLKGSLKKYGARLHAKRLQELPFDPARVLSRDEAALVKNYCLASDIPATELIFSQLQEQINLRYDLSNKYNVDLRSKSDAQIAESVVRSEVLKKTGRKLKLEKIPAGTKYRYIPPPFLKFDSVGILEAFFKIQNMDFEIEEDLKMSMPEELLEMEIRIGETDYKLGKGGLHSKEKRQAYRAENGYLIIDSDVESYYPRLILNSGMYPEAIGPIFLEIFEEIVNRRLSAKALAGSIEKELKEIEDKLSEKYKSLNIQIQIAQSESDGLKITINGTFGKLGSRFSVMYAPNLLIQVTLTGQLALLMLISRLETAGIKVISANTDGIVAYCHESKYELLKSIREQWSRDCNLKMEETRYKALYSANVNNYIAIKEDGKAKLKGWFSNPWNDKKLAIFRFHKNPVTTICIEAVELFLTKGIPLEETIRACRDIKKFVTVRDVKGGAHRNGQFIGSLVRYVYAEGETSELNYMLSGNKVPDSEGAFPLLDMPEEFPEYIDYKRYIEKAETMLYSLGYYRKAESLNLFQ